MKLLMEGLGVLGVRAARAEIWDRWECEPKPANAWSWVCGGDYGTGGANGTSGSASRTGNCETSGTSGSASRTGDYGRMGRVGYCAKKLC